MMKLALSKPKLNGTKNMPTLTSIKAVWDHYDVIQVNYLYLKGIHVVEHLYDIPV